VASSAEASARTVEAAVAAAAAELGLRPDQVEVEVLKQPVASTFGKVGEPAVVRVVGRSGEVVELSGGVESSAGESEMAAVAAAPPAAVETTGHVQETAPATADRARAPRPRESSGGGRRHPEVTDPEAIAADTELAGDFVEGLLDALDVDGDITTWVDVAGGHVDIEGQKLDFLVGTEGETLNALQELTRLAVLRQTQRWVRITVDVNGFKARRRQEIASMAREIGERVASSRQDEELEPMSAFERKIVHDVIADLTGVQSDSIGEEPNRRVVVRPA
jgi:spoIIIJ-associated protein